MSDMIVMFVNEAGYLHKERKDNMTGKFCSPFLVHSPSQGQSGGMENLALLEGWPLVRGILDTIM